ncbi:leucine-rich repeat domain-containing protein [Metabacillus bambusae]|uniref:Leucine-rich repeat domain-containing protein n=1 Tax=Metabacillus bambusae TaxID=2795218 RepID=A0ABS3N0J5_9BACI|nr:leucine-rich repeat domain-containing protein [Metabacillus bambusae]MBO1511782.1 leucine-rich repeat domain-containing protein [Metabacillus bambusae]
MTKRFVSLSLVVTLLFTLITPFLSTAVAVNESMTILPAENIENGIKLQWSTISSSHSEESFTLLKNTEETNLPSVEVIESSEDKDGNLHRTYQLVDEQVVVGETYTYTVKKTGDIELQTQPIEVTYEQEKEAIAPFEINTTSVTDNSIKVSWSEFLEADRYQVLVDGKIVDEVEQAVSYELKDLQSGTSYSVSIRAIGEGAILKEASKNITTTQKPEEESVDTSSVTESKEKVSITASEPSGELVTIPDSALKRAIKAALQLKRDEIYVSDMESLTTLDASYSGIKDVTGLEKAINLTKLELAGNDIKDAAALQGLTKLNYLDLTSFQGENIEFLPSLTNLKTLILAESLINNVEPIATLSSLETLDISYIELTTILPLQQLTNLSTLTIYGELYFSLIDEVQSLERDGLTINHDDSYKIYITSIKANEERAIISWEYDGEDVNYYEVKVADKVTHVDPDEVGNQITVDTLQPNTEYTVEIFAFNDKDEQIGKTVSTFKTLSAPEGEKVIFKDAQLEKAIKAEFGLERDIFISDLKGLEELYLDSNRIQDLSGIEAATNLQSLSLSGNRISDLTPLASLQNLRNLYVDGNPLVNFTALEGLTNLESLHLGETGIKDLSILADLQNLSDLSLNGNNLESIETLPALEGLLYLSLYENDLKDLKGIEKLTQLAYIDVDVNPISSLADIKQLTKLEGINLSYTSIEKIDELLQFEQLQYVSLYGTEQLDLAEGSAAQQVIAQLIANGVMVDYEGAEEEEWLEAYINTITENSLSLYWDYYGEQEIKTYEVYVNGELHSELSGEESFLEIDGLKPATEYDIEVKAYNGDGDLVLSSNISETTWSEPTGETVPFKDNNLKELIKEQLGLDRDLRESDLEKLISLSLIESDIKDLSGLEFASNLSDFYVFGNAATLDLSPLKNLSELNYVHIEDADLKNYSVLKEMKNVSSLAIVNSNLSDISFLSGMTNLYDLTLINNGLKDISALSGLRKLNFISLANNKIEDLTPLSGLKGSLNYLDVSGNPIKDLSSIADLENLYYLILDETMISDLTALRDLPSLEYVSLYNISTLDLKDKENAQVISDLKDWGVQVNLDVDSSPELKIDEVTEDSISISWDPMLPKGIGTYNVSLYSNNGELVEDIEIDSSETRYQFLNLSPNTDYYIEVNVEEDEYYGFLSADVTTLPIEGSVKDVSLYVYKTVDIPEVDATFDLYGIDEETENIYYFGWSDEQGRLIDVSTGEEMDILELPVGNYEITFVTADEEEVSFQFEINGTEDYLEEPILFLLEDGDDDPVTAPGDGQDEGVDPQKPTPDDENPSKGNDSSIGEKPVDSNNIVTEPVKVENKNQLPKTATVMYNLLAVGLIVLALGGIVLFIQKRKRVSNM